MEFTRRNNRPIVFLIPALKVGGAELAMMRLIKEIKSSNQHAKLILFVMGRNQSTSGYEWLQEFCEIKTIPIKYNDHFTKLSSLIYLVYLRMYINRVQPMKVICFGELWNILTLGFLYNLNLEIVISERSDPDLNYSKGFRIFRNLLYPLAKVIIFQTQRAWRKVSSEVDNLNAWVIPNFNNIQLSKDSRNNVNGKAKLMTASRFIPSKRIDLLIRMMNNEFLSENSELLIYGDDDHIKGERESLEKLVEQKGLKTIVQFKGKSHNLIEEFMKGDAFVFTSESEGYPNVIMESLAAGMEVFTLKDFNEIKDYEFSNYHVCEDIESMVIRLKEFIQNIESVRNNRDKTIEQSNHILERINTESRDVYFRAILGN